MRVSIVVPVYNVEKYLRRCLDSVLEQTYSDVEVVLVDDGSTDTSGSICDEYTAQNSHFRVVHKENGGLSSARNCGIDSATGEYILLLDSDDYIKKDILSEIMWVLENQQCDVFVGCARSVDEQGKEGDKGKYTIPSELLSGEAYLRHLYRQNTPVSFCAQFMIYKKAFLDENNLRFCEGLLHEDELWTPSVLLKAKTVYYADLMFYYHFVRSGSIMHSKNHKKRVESVQTITTQLQNLYAQHSYETTKFLYDRLAMICLSTARFAENASDYAKTIGRMFPLRCARKGHTFGKSLIFSINPKLYVKLANRGAVGTAQYNK